MTVRCTGFMNAMLTCEELFLLLTKDSGKPESRMTYPAYGLTGGAAHRPTAGRPHQPDRGAQPPRLHRQRRADRAPRPGPGPGDPARQGRQAILLPGVLGQAHPTRHIAESLAAAGVVRIHTGGLFGSLNPSYPTLDPLPERQLRARIDAALRGVQPPTASDVALLSILQALSVAPTVLPQQETGLSRGELKRRIKELAGENPVGRAVQRAVEAVTMAIIAAGSVAAASSS